MQLRTLSLSAIARSDLACSRRAWLVRFVALALGLAGVAAHAANVPVTNTNNGLVGSLRQAIQDANPGDTVVFQIPATDPGYNAATGVFTIALTGGELVVSKNLTIEGAGAKIVVKRSGAPGGAANFRIFNVTAGTVNISSLTITGGIVGFGGPGVTYGGGILNTGILTVRSCTVSGNTANSGGGGIANDATGTLTITNSTIFGNEGRFPGGGGVYNLGALTINNSTFLGNHNVGSPGGGIANAGAGTVRVRNTIIAGNTVSGAVGLDVSGTFVSDGYNFIGQVDQGSTGFGNSGSHDQIGSNAAPADPKLGPLQDNGGPTATMRPLAGSLVIDQGLRGTDANGAPINTDQRGYPRPIDQLAITDAGGGDGSDIGAVEVGLPQTGATLTVTNTAERNDGCTTDDCTLLEAMNVANAETDANTITFAPGVRGSILNTIVPGGLNIVNPLTIFGPGARVLTISGNSASRIFNIASAAGTVEIFGLTLSNGRAGGSTFLDKCGGALLNAASLTLLDCTVRESSATLHGAGIYNNGQNGNAVLTLLKCTFTGNAASGSGAAIFNAGYSGHATSTLTNCTLDQNDASQYGGAIYNDGTSSGNAALTLTNCTLNKNDAGSGAGGIYNDALNPSNNTGVATVFLQNTILMAAGTSANLVNDSNGGGTINSQGNNISNDNGGGFLDQSTDRVSIFPGLDTLKNNGGPTDTVALLGESVARNTGNDNAAPETDQRGYFRNGTSDVGAFEFSGVPPVPPMPPSVTTGAATEIGSTSASLTATVNPNGLATSVEFVTDFGASQVVGAGNGTDNVLVKVDATGLTPNTTYHYHAVATNMAGTTEGAEQTFTTLPGVAPTPTPSPTPRTNLGNLSTRLRVETGDNALFAGMIVSGTQPKRVIIRGTGTSLTIADKLANPTLELHGPSGFIEENDNWVDSPNKQAIINSGVAPSNDLEPAIIATLPAGNSGYTAILRGANNGTGIGVIEVYDLDPLVDSTLANISTRGLAQTGDNVLFAGTIVVGPGSRKVIVRAIGPSLSISGKMADPVLQLFNQNGGLLEENDNWVDSPNKQAILDSTIPPTNNLESAIVATLPGNNASYTAIVRGVNNSTGIALVEVYALED